MISMKILVIKMQKNAVHFPSLIEFVSGSLLRYTDEKFRHKNTRAYSNGRRKKKEERRKKKEERRKKKEEK